MARYYAHGTDILFSTGQDQHRSDHAAILTSARPQFRGEWRAPQFRLTHRFHAIANGRRWVVGAQYEGSWRGYRVFTVRTIREAGPAAPEKELDLEEARRGTATVRWQGRYRVGRLPAGVSGVYIIERYIGVRGYQPIYVGTAKDVKTRVESRSDALRHFGVPLNRYWIRVGRVPGGESKWRFVEHVLVRRIYEHLIGLVGETQAARLLTVRSPRAPFRIPHGARVALDFSGSRVGAIPSYLVRTPGATSLSISGHSGKAVPRRQRRYELKTGAVSPAFATVGLA